MKVDPGAVEQHRAAAGREAVRCVVITLSDSRTESTDESGRYLREALVRAGHRLVGYRLIPDEPLALRAALDGFISAGAQAVLCTGGTGIGTRDQTIETLQPLWERLIPGFGELFRMLSFAQVGAAAMLSRAAAGVYMGAVVFALPGSTSAVELAWRQLIEPELRHLVHLIGPGTVRGGPGPADRSAGPDRS